MNKQAMQRALNELNNTLAQLKERELFIQGKKRLAFEGKQLWLAIQMLATDPITTVYRGMHMPCRYHRNDVIDFGIS